MVQKWKERKIKEFSNLDKQVNLAISLHAPDNEIRDKIMPINKAYKIEELISTLKEYIEKTNRRVTFEYILLDKVNDSVKSASGNIVYLDKSQKHMYELNNKVRLINVTDFPVSNCDEFLGFICGIVSQDHDLQEMYLDSFLTIANIEDGQLNHAIEKLDIISEKYNVKFVLSVSRNEADLPECAKAKIIVSL